VRKEKAVSVSKYGGEIKAKSKWMYNLYASYLKTKLKHFTDRNLETLITKYCQFPCSITNSGNRLTFCADLPVTLGLRDTHFLDITHPKQQL